jgi:hypothetical protein
VKYVYWGIQHKASNSAGGQLNSPVVLFEGQKRTAAYTYTACDQQIKVFYNVYIYVILTFKAFHKNMPKAGWL